MSLTFYYWGMKGRGQLPVIVAMYGELPLVWERNPAWPAMKEETLFGQLPFLVDGDIKVSQSNAIARYLGRKANILGESDADFALSEALVEEQADLFTLLVKANYDAEKEQAFVKTFAESFPAHLQKLEALLQQDFFTSKLTLGSLAIFSVLNFALDLEPSVLDATPKLKAFYQRVAALPTVKSYLDLNVPAYFKRG